MSQRNSGYARREADLYETPAWVTHALCNHIGIEGQNIWEPACGSGQMVLPLTERGAAVCGTDIRQDPSQDFLALDVALECSAIVTNPPYEQAREFCEHALRLMEPVRGSVAMLLRTDFDHAVSRSHLFRDCPAFSSKLVLMKRIAWFVEANGKPKASPSFNHAWYVWDWRHRGPPTISYGPSSSKFNQNVNLRSPRKSLIGTTSHADLFAHPPRAQRSPRTEGASPCGEGGTRDRKPSVTIGTGEPFLGGTAS